MQFDMKRDNWLLPAENSTPDSLTFSDFINYYFNSYNSSLKVKTENYMARLRGILYTEAQKANLRKVRQEQSLLLMEPYINSVKIKYELENKTCNEIVKELEIPRYRVDKIVHKYNFKRSPEFKMQTVKRIGDGERGTKMTPQQRENVSKGHLGQKAWNKGLTKETDERMMKTSNTMTGVPHSDERREAISKGREKGKKPVIKDLENFRKMCRLGALKRISKQKGQVSPSYNRKSIKFFKELDKNFNTKGIYAENPKEFHIKEQGFWADYINFDKKIIIEWDEESHYKNNLLIERDVSRQRIIQKIYPDFQFIRIRQKLVKSIGDFTNLVKEQYSAV